MDTRKHPRPALFLFILAVLLPGWSSAGITYEGVVVFGDSLTDTGNKFAETGDAKTPPYSDLPGFFLVADGLYARGGLHHSNGATWIEQFARPLDLGDAVRPALRDPGVATNYAYGGARARPGGVIPVIPNENKHLPDQVGQFLADFNMGIPTEALYVVFIGGNDIFDATVVLDLDPSSTTSLEILDLAVASVDEQIRLLHDSGARKFLVITAPDLGITPAVRIVDEELAGGFGIITGAATDFSDYYNFMLAGTLLSLGALPDIEIITYNITPTFRDLVNNPSDFGLENGTGLCVMPDVPPYACKKPDDYVFWDGVHPTKVTHGIFAAEVAELLAE
jgi:phospholipase/lecithinase/hemolysin